MQEETGGRNGGQLADADATEYGTQRVISILQQMLTCLKIPQYDSPDIYFFFTSYIVLLGAGKHCVIVIYLNILKAK